MSAFIYVARFRWRMWREWRTFFFCDINGVRDWTIFLIPVPNPTNLIYKYYIIGSGMDFTRDGDLDSTNSKWVANSIQVAQITNPINSKFHINFKQIFISVSNKFLTCVP